jgi:hypothetical protein
MQHLASALQEHYIGERIDRFRGEHRHFGFSDVSEWGSAAEVGTWSADETTVSTPGGAAKAGSPIPGTPTEPI